MESGVAGMKVASSACHGERNYNELDPTLCFPAADLGRHSRKRLAITARNPIGCIRQPPGG